MKGSLSLGALCIIASVPCAAMDQNSKDLEYFRSAHAVAQLIFSMGKPPLKTSTHRVITFDDDSIEKPLVQDYKICDRLVIVPSDHLRPEEQSKDGLFLEIEETGPMHIITPWGKWQFVEKTCVFGDGDKRFHQKLRALPELGLVPYNRRERQFGRNPKHTVLHSMVYFITRAPNIGVLGYAKLKEKDLNMSSEAAKALWKQLKQHYEFILQ